MTRPGDKAKLIQLREDRQQQTDDVYNYFSAMRRTLDELHGDGKAFVMAGIEGPTARLTRKLLRQVDLALPLLKSPELKPQPKVAGITVDTVAMGSVLESLADKLRATQTEFQRARHEPPPEESTAEGSALRALADLRTALSAPARSAPDV